MAWAPLTLLKIWTPATSSKARAKSRYSLLKGAKYILVSVQMKSAWWRMPGSIWRSSRRRRASTLENMQAWCRWSARWCTFTPVRNVWANQRSIARRDANSRIGLRAISSSAQGRRLARGIRCCILMWKGLKQRLRLSQKVESWRNWVLRKEDWRRCCP